MAKHINRLRARLALGKLAESKNSWIISKDMVLKTESGDLALNKGSIVNMYATHDGKLAVKEAGVTIVIDDDLADKVADNATSAEELGDVKFVKKSALDAALDGTTVEELIAGLADSDDEDSEEIETAEVDVEEKESVQEKFAKLENGERISDKDALYCEEIEIDEEDDSPINLGDVQADTVNKEEMADYEEYKARISELGGSIQPGQKEIALSADGKVIGYFDTEANSGVIYPDMAFESEEEMDNFSDEPQDLVQPVEFESSLEEPALEAVEEALKAYEESDKSASDYVAMTESLAKVGLDESVIGKIANTFVSRKLSEGTVVLFDKKFGAVVKSFKESVEANQFAADTAEEKRFSKRFIA